MQWRTRSERRQQKSYITRISTDCRRGSYKSVWQVKPVKRRATCIMRLENHLLLPWAFRNLILPAIFHFNTAQTILANEELWARFLSGFYRQATTDAAATVPVGVVAIILYFIKEFCGREKRALVTCASHPVVRDSFPKEN